MGERKYKEGQEGGEKEEENMWEVSFMTHLYKHSVYIHPGDIAELLVGSVHENSY